MMSKQAPQASTRDIGDVASPLRNFAERNAAVMALAGLAAAAVLTPAAAGAGEWTAATVMNHDLVIAGYALWQDDCSQNGLPDVRFDKPPPHGKAFTTEGIVTVSRSSRGPSDPCMGKQVPGLLVIYSPDPGFTGDDEMVFRHFSEINKVHIKVKQSQ